LRRAIEHLLEDPLAEQLLNGSFQGKDTITVKVHEVEGEKKLYFDATTAVAPAQLVAAGNEGKS
jgi:ATP-dependent Clp protease ATP-binding subunit ClpC